MRVIHLIRHARPESHGLLIGCTDSPLCGDPVDPLSIEPEYVFTSPLRRACETARLLFPERPVITLPGLAERALGEWEGLRWEQVASGWPDLASAAMQDWFAATPPGGEPWDAFVERVREASMQFPPAGVVAVVAHLGVNSVLWHLAGRGPALSFRQDYCEVITLD